MAERKRRTRVIGPHHTRRRSVQMRLLAGYGFWDVTSFPYGGSFHREREDRIVEVVPGGAVKYPMRESRVMFPDGRQAVVGNDALVPVDAPPSGLM